MKAHPFPHRKSIYLTLCCPTPHVHLSRNIAKYTKSEEKQHTTRRLSNHHYQTQIRYKMLERSDWVFKITMIDMSNMPETVSSIYS